MISSIRFALRSIFKSPGFAAVTLLSLALGIGANTAIFSLANGLLLKTLPVTEPEQLVLFNWAASPETGPRSHSGHVGPVPETGERTSTSFAWAAFEQFQAPSDSLADVFAFMPLWRINAMVDGDARNLETATVVSGNYHQALGVRMIKGRGLEPADDQAGANPVAVISHRYWQQRFGGESSVLGKTLALNQVPFTIVGITAEGFRGTGQVGEIQDVTIPFSHYLAVEPGDKNFHEPWAWSVRIMGRLASGSTLEQAQAEMEGRFAASYEGHLNFATENDHMRLRTESGALGLNEDRREYTTALNVLAAIVGLILLIACVNVANLLLARGAARQQEMTVRAALGASRWRLIGQLLTESLLLSIMGAALGAVFSLWIRDGLMHLFSADGSGFELDASMDARVLAFTVLVAVFTGVLFGLLPALRATRSDLVSGFHGSQSGLSAPKSRISRILMMAQIGLSLLLMTGAGLFNRTLSNLREVDAGFEQENLVLFGMDATSVGYKTEGLDQLYSRISDRLASLPGVERAAFSMIPMLSGGTWTRSQSIEGNDHLDSSERVLVANAISPGFLDTLRIPLLLGRTFTVADGPDAPRVALVNQAFVRKYFPDSTVIGRRLGRSINELDTTIVGVVTDAKYANIKEEARPAMFLPHAQVSRARPGNFAVRTHGSISGLEAIITKAVREIAPGIPLINFRTQREQTQRFLTEEKMFSRLTLAFAVLSLLLAAIGLYGLLAYSVARRTGEIGLRMALGALPEDVRRLILGDTLRVAGAGVLLGLLGSVALLRLISSQLYGVSAFDPSIYSLSALLLLAVTLVAGDLPARRAARIDPIVALRQD